MLEIRKAAALSLVVLPLLMAGCGSSPEPAEPEDRSGDSWIDVAEGKRVASPSTTYGKASPTPELTLPPLPAKSKPAGSASPSCATAPKGSGVINGLDVTPGSRSAVVGWYHPGGRSIVDYRVTATSQDLKVGEQIEVGWTQVMPATCGPVSATVGGLQPGTPYVFSVDAVMTRTGKEGTYTATVARSGVVSTT